MSIRKPQTVQHWKGKHEVYTDLFHGTRQQILERIKAQLDSNLRQQVDIRLCPPKWMSKYIYICMNIDNLSQICFINMTHLIQISCAASVLDKEEGWYLFLIEIWSVQS